MKIRTAGPADCPSLVETSMRAFHADVNHGAPVQGGPPGYDSVAWHEEAMTWSHVFTLTEDDRLAGGVIVVLNSPTEAYLGRIWLAPEFQNRGLGAQAMAVAEATFPDVTRWTLGTPVWNTRNHHFYARCGYRVVGVEGEDGLLFEKITAAGVR